MTLTSCLIEAARRFGDAPAYVAENGLVLSYAELALVSDEVAAGLGRRGVGEGDVLALALPTIAEYFVCYLAAAHGFGAVRGVALADRFGAGYVDVVAPRYLCRPADANGAGIADAATHLESYRIAPLTVHARRKSVQVSTRFGQVTVDTTQPDLLLVPTAADPTAPPPRLDPRSAGLDRYQCYKVHRARGTRAPSSGPITVTDESSDSPVPLDTARPRHLCLPVDEGGDGFWNPNAGLVCYAVSGGSRAFTRGSEYVGNEFGEDFLVTRRRSEFCVPALTRQ